MAIHPANARYQRLILSAPYEICIERARYVTESYRRTEGQHPARRAAAAFRHTLAKVSLYLLDEELIAGNRSGKLVGTVIPVERGDINTVIELELDALTSRPSRPWRIDSAERRELLEDILPYWRGQTVHDRKNELLKRHDLVFRPAWSPQSMIRRLRSLDLGKLRRLSAIPNLSPHYLRRAVGEVLYNNPAMVMNVFDVQGHMILGHKNVLRQGFRGIRRQAMRRLNQARRAGDDEGIAFLEAAIDGCEAIRDFAGRLADLAAEKARTVKGKKRRRELEAIAARCRRVPYEAPRDFREAVQALWITQVGATLAYGMPGIFAVGRLDRHLEPFYQRDKAAGRLTDAEAVRWLEELLIKLSYNIILLPSFGKATGNELGADSCSPTVGGVDENGRDATNLLSYLILDAFANVKATGNSFTIRLSAQTPKRFWKKALATFRTTSGAALYNDEVAVPALVNCGMPVREARDYGVIGCVEPTGDADTFGCTSGNDVSLVAALEMALLNGTVRIMGRRIGPATGDPRRFAAFEDLFAAYEKQLSFLIDLVARAVVLKDRVYAENYPNPFISSTVTGCVGKARDLTRGGARYNFGSIGGRGLGTTVNALAAIRDLVYVKRETTLAELCGALDNNFKGAEILRARLLNRAPKYGADMDEADAIAKRVAEFFCREVSRHQTERGGPFRPGFFSYGMHVMEGLFLGATADGRLSGEPVSNSFSPANGSEKLGPIGVFRSVAKIDQRLITNGCALNIKFLPSLFDTDERLEKMIGLLKGFFASGGMEVQPNVVSNAVLRRAQEHPEDYRDLVVRVSGYSANFTDLGRPLQDEIISRPEFGTL